jgi:hypothetical protein
MRRMIKVHKPIPIHVGEAYYEVDDVLEKRFGEHGAEYFVSWVGYPPCDNMWIGVLPIFFKKRWGSRNASSVTNGFNALVESATDLLLGDVYM